MRWPNLQVERADGHPSGWVRTGSGHPPPKAAARASLEHMEDGGRPGPLLDVSPLASALSTCAALMELLGKPFVDPATSRGSWHASPEGDPLALRAADVPSQAAGSVRNRARSVTSTGRSRGPVQGSC